MQAKLAKIKANALLENNIRFSLRNHISRASVVKSKDREKHVFCKSINYICTPTEYKHVYISKDTSKLSMSNSRQNPHFDLYAPSPNLFH